FPQIFQIHRRTQRTADQTLDLQRTTTLLAAAGLALHALAGGARQHAVLGSDPALPGTPQEARHAAFHTGGTDHLGIAELDQYRALRMPGVVTGQGYLTKLIGGAATGSCHLPILDLRVCAASIRGRVRGTRRW